METSKELMSLMDKLNELEGFNGLYEEIADLKVSITEKLYGHFKDRETRIELNRAKLCYLPKDIENVVVYFDKKTQEVTVAQEYYNPYKAYEGLGRGGGFSTEELGEYIKGLSLSDIKCFLESDQDLLCWVSGIPDMGVDGICDLIH